jgi:hypothetical protein
MEILEKKRGRKKELLENKFNRLIEKTDTCWIWMGAVNSKGYGLVLDDAGKLQLVHRLLHERVNGKIPPNASVLHSCDNPSCCNPVHLRVGSSKENMDEKISKNRDHSNRGTNHWNNRFTDDQILAIRNDTRTQIEIAKEYGISQPHVSIIKNSKTRKILGIKQEPRQLELQFSF